jgi:hypothetical protein
MVAGVLIIFLLAQFVPPFETVNAAGKCNWVRLVADVTVPDGSIFRPGEAFTKTWRLKNNGTCTWTTAYRLVFDSGALLGAPTSVALPRSVAPDQTIDLSLPMTAPATAGSQRGFWMLQDARGNRFGVGTLAASPFWVDIRVVPITPTPTPGATGLNLQGTVRLSGRGLANVRIYRQMASYGEVLVATTGLDGKYKADFLFIPGDETITIRPAMNGFVFTPVNVSWRHYHGLENKTLDFTASFAPPPPDPTVIDFTTDICAARWVSGAGTLPCPMVSGDARGYAVRQDHPTLEDGTSGLEAGLLVAPQNKYDGYIQGFFPEYTVVAGDRFQATVGCAYGASCYVTYRLDYQIGNGPLKILWSWKEKNEGKVYNTMVNLNPLAGQKVKFVLTLLAAGPATNDRAIWGQPRITRERSLWPTITPTPTPEVPKVTTAGVDVRYPAMVVCGAPNTINVYGNLTTNGPANVTYYLEIDGVRVTADQVLVFTAAGTQTLEFGDYTQDCGDHTVRLVTTAPNFWSGLTYYSIPQRGFTDTPRPSSTPSPTPLPSATVTPTLAGQVSAVTAAINPPAGVNCASPMTVEITGSLTTNGPALVTYHWEISGSATNTLPENTLFVTSASTFAANLGSYTLNCGDYIARLVVTGPNLTSAQAGLSLKPPPVLPIYNFTTFEMIGVLTCSDVSSYSWTPQTCNGESGGCLISQTPLFGIAQAGFLRADGNALCGLNLP